MSQHNWSNETPTPIALEFSDVSLRTITLDEFMWTWPCMEISVCIRKDAGDYLCSLHHLWIYQEDLSVNSKKHSETNPTRLSSFTFQFTKFLDNTFLLFKPPSVILPLQPNWLTFCPWTPVFLSVVLSHSWRCPGITHGSVLRMNWNFSGGIWDAQNLAQWMNARQVLSSVLILQATLVLLIDCF